MSSDDEVGTGWTLDADAARALRLEAADQALLAHDPARAVVEIEELLHDVPYDVEGLWLLAEAAMELRDFPVAAEAWAGLTERVPERAPVWTQLALCAFEVGDVETAKTAARHAIQRYDDLGEAWYVLGLCLERTEGAAVAAEAFRKAHRISPLGFPLPLDLDARDTRALLDEARTHLSAEAAALWAQVPVSIVPFPNHEDLATTGAPLSPRAVALYEGSPPGPDTPEARPPGLKVFSGNLAHHEGAEAAVDALVDALEAEADDWLPPSDDD